MRELTTKRFVALTLKILEVRRSWGLRWSAHRSSSMLLETMSPPAREDERSRRFWGPALDGESS
jgi:hypothetical protein